MLSLPVLGRGLVPALNRTGVDGKTVLSPAWNNAFLIAGDGLPLIIVKKQKKQKNQLQVERGSLKM